MCLKTCRGLQILHTLPAHYLPKVLGPIHPQPDPTGLSPSGGPRALLPSLVHLLLLLPPSLHPAVLQARCPSISRRGALFLPAMPHHATLDGGCPQRAPLTVQALAAAAAFASGGPADVRSPPQQPLTTATPLHHFHKNCRTASPSANVTDNSICGQAMGSPPAGEDALQRCPVPDTTVATPLVSLNLELGIPEPPRWSNALAQLRTLQDLQLRVSHIEMIDVAAMLRAVRALPALRRLGLYAAEPADPELPFMVQLLEGVCELTTLRALKLHKCFFWTRNDGHADAAALAQLSRLTGLTHLSLRDSPISKECAAAFEDALQHLSQLQRLCVAGTRQALPFVMSLCRRGALPGLVDLDICSSGFSRWDKLAELCERAWSRLTALSLGRVNHTMHVPTFLALLLGMPALRCLGLRLTVFREEGAAALAEVLPVMEHLSGLDLSKHDMPVEFLAQVVSAAGNARGGRGLRRVAVGGGGGHYSEDDVWDLAQRLPGLPELESVDVSVDCAPGVVPVAVAALKHLPRLSELVLQGKQTGATEWEGVAAALAELPALRRVEITEVAQGAGRAVREVVEAAVPGVAAAVQESDESFDGPLVCMNLDSFYTGPESFQFADAGPDYFSDWSTDE